MAPFSSLPRSSGCIMSLTGLIAVCIAITSSPVVNGGLIVKRQALESDATTRISIEETTTVLPATVTSTSTRMIDFQGDPKQPLTRAIEFGFNYEDSSEPAMVAELRQFEPSRVASTTEAPAANTLASVVMTTTTTTQPNVTEQSSPVSVSRNVEEKLKRLVSEQITTTVAAPLVYITTTTSSPVIAALLRDEKTDTPPSIERGAAGELPVTESESESTTSARESQTIPVSLASEESGSGEVATTVSTDGAENITRFDLNRYILPSNFSDGGISLEDTRQERQEFFATTELAESWDTTTTLPALSGTEDRGLAELLATTETNEIIVPPGLVNKTHTIESNRTVRVDKSEVETNDYEVISNEVRNQTVRSKGKKGKFLDQFGATEDNDINGAVWALAGMRLVDRTSNKAGQATGESVEVIRDDDENVIANNTLKQLTDWAIIMQDADFANSSFVRPTSGEVGIASDAKNRITYANRDPNTDALSEENRITPVVTDVLPEGSAEVTVAVPKANMVMEVPTTTSAADDELEDFKFEDRSKVVFETTKRPEITNFIQETTTILNAKTESLDTTMRPAGGYEVTEKTDDNEQFALPVQTTTLKTEVTTMMEDVPITTYSPASPLTRRTEPTTAAVTLTTTTLKPVVTTSQESVTPSSFKSVEETTFQMTTTTTTTTTTAATTTSESNSSLINELAEIIDDGDNRSPEVDPNAINQTDSEPVMTSSTSAPTSPVVLAITDPIISHPSTVQPTSGTTEKVDLSGQVTESTELFTNEQVVVDDKNVYDTMPESIESERTFPPQIQSTAEPSTTTRRSVERQMTTTTTELSEEESITEEEYIEANPSVPAGGASEHSSAKAPLDRQPAAETTPTPVLSESEEGGSGVVVAIVASLVSVIVVLLLIAAFLVFRKRQAQVSYGQRCRPVGLDAYSLDNVSVYNSVRRKGNTMRMSKRSYGNSAFEDPGLKTNPLTVVELANIIQNKTAIYDEFKEIPNVTARADEVPEGCEDKNRYANVVPLPETRVHLKRINNDERSEYINANFVKGPKDSGNYYIACQAPMENTINDFWRMIWEQNSKVIIMATDLSENGVEKCAEYLPPSVVLDNNRTFGDFQLTLKNRENKEKYTISTVHLRNTQTNTWREIMHFWYQWPDTGVPIDESSIIAMLLEARSYSRLAPGEMAEFTGGITSIAEEDSIEDGKSSISNGVTTSNSVDSSNNNNYSTLSGKTLSDSVPPCSIVTNGGVNTIDKHRSLQRTQGPITVHCSPGTGRTGTIVACDVALRAVEIPPRTVDIPHIVYYVRRGRASAVRTREQYELIYRVANVYATKLTGPTIET
ncbi:mucin-2 isoform X2 [Toxorhynchites rutilus septentrionalis]|uniref:mucin-2 isoform X2 n=1 Tax=Toxorhynchites rutilus septentrionalis TaxID=329112 RepID=UPI00247A8A9C|nr:mucin-2 isoform X2 [Toxorhynchites rutilus septentrionalis]